MSLKRAMDDLPDDRRTRAAAEAVVRYFDGHRSLHLDTSRVAAATRQEQDRVDEVVSVLVIHHVLDCVSDPPGYRLASDKVLELEVSRFLRTSHAASLQSNVERYRKVFGDR
jgi:hypothetical protein